MMPHVVADVGNSRIKCGRCRAGAMAEVCTLLPDRPDEWQRQLERWDLPTLPKPRA